MVITREIQTMCTNIKKIRKENNLTQKEMAKKLGIGVKSLSKLENGIIPKRLSTSLIFKIYTYFGIKPFDLFSPF